MMKSCSMTKAVFLAWRTNLRTEINESGSAWLQGSYRLMTLAAMIRCSESRKELGSSSRYTDTLGIPKPAPLVEIPVEIDAQTDLMQVR